MDTSTGHLVRDIEFVPAEKRKDYTPVPRRLRRAAEKKLDGKDEAVVDLARRTQLAQWARADRRKKKSRRRLEKVGRKAARK